jgi:thioredoxin 1
MKNIKIFAVTTTFTTLASAVLAFRPHRMPSTTRRPPAAPLHERTTNHIVELNDGNYKDLFSDACLVKAEAKWCGPCRLISPVVERCAEKFQEDLVVAKFDVEALNPDVKIELIINKVSPKSLPSLILFQKGKAIASRNGVVDDEELEDFLNEHLKKESRSRSVLDGQKSSGFISMTNSVDDYMLSGLH